MDFITWTNANLLTHLDTSGVHLSWSNGPLNVVTVAFRQDRAIWLSVYFLLEFWSSRPSCTYYFLFFLIINIYRVSGGGWRLQLDTNLVGMFLYHFDALPTYLLIKKN